MGSISRQTGFSRTTTGEALVLAGGFSVPDRIIADHACGLAQQDSPPGTKRAGLAGGLEADPITSRIRSTVPRVAQAPSLG
jgi:hypothetical protein